MLRVTQVAAVLLLAGICAGLFFKAVGSVRNAAAKSSCKNNLRSLVLAIHNYASANDGGLPRATFGSNALPPERHLSWIFELDGYLESHMDPERTRYRTEPWDSEGNLRIARKRLIWVHCPGSPITSTQEGYTITNYVGPTGLGSDSAMLPKEDPRAGLFGYERKIKISQIPDNSQSTIAVLETSHDNGPWMAGGRPTSRAFEVDGSKAIGTGGQFGGLHRDGLNVGFADGSVRFLSESIDRNTFAAFLTIAGGEKVIPVVGE